jgi:hypothetical protein
MECWALDEKNKPTVIELEGEEEVQEDAYISTSSSE